MPERGRQKYTEVSNPETCGWEEKIGREALCMLTDWRVSHWYQSGLMLELYERNFRSN